MAGYEPGRRAVSLAEPATGGGRLASFCSFAGNRIIGLYTHPHWAGRGVAGALLGRAEAAIVADGHARIGITATLGGRAFYEKHGYRVLQARDFRTRGGLFVAVLEMEKWVTRTSFSLAPGRGERVGVRGSHRCAHLSMIRLKQLPFDPLHPRPRSGGEGNRKKKRGK